MSTTRADRLQLLALQNAPILLFAAIFAYFGLRRSNFFSGTTLELIASQAAVTGILAVGMTFVLLTAGIDLSVGATMYVCAIAIGVTSPIGPHGLLLSLLVCGAVGVVVGGVNSFFITRLGVVAFVVTLATQFVWRGLATAHSKSETFYFPQSILDIGPARLDTPVWDIPVPIIAFAAVVAVAHLVLTRTPFGRQIYAVVNNVEAAKKAGIATRRVLAAVYVLCGLCAGIAALIAAGQLNVAAPDFGRGREFDAISAAVLGGTSLFGGRGNVFPGTVVGALLFQMIAVGLVFTGVDIYMQPVVTAGIIFLAVFLDGLRNARLAKLERRYIRVEEEH